MSTKFERLKVIKNAKSVKNGFMRKINLILQEILKFVLLFLFFFVWTRYFLRKLWTAILISLLLTACLYAILFILKRKKQNKIGLKLKEKEEAENMFLSLSCESNPMDFFVKLASKKHKEIKKYKNYLVINHVNDGVKTLLWFDNSFYGLTIARFMEIYGKVKKEKATKIVICCKEIAEKQLITFSQNFNEKFLFLNEYDSYEKLYKFYDCYPEITRKYSKEKKMVFKDFIAYSFNKKRTKGYLFSAFILILSSLFIRTTIYYCIIASILVVFALVSQFNPYYNSNKEIEVI